MYNWNLPPVNSSLNGYIISNWNCDVLCFFKTKTWRVQYDFENVFFWIPKLARCKVFKTKSHAFWNFEFKIMLFRKAPKIQSKSFSRSKLNHNVIFWMQTIFWNLTCWKSFNSKSNALYFSIQILTLCKTFKSKSDAFWNFYFEIWRVRENEFKIWEFLKFFSPKCDFYLVFQVLTEGRCFLSTLITAYFTEENWTTMFVLDLVTRCTTVSYQTSIRVSMVV